MKSSKPITKNPTVRITISVAQNVADLANRMADKRRQPLSWYISDLIEASASK